MLQYGYYAISKNFYNYRHTNNRNSNLPRRVSCSVPISTRIVSDPINNRIKFLS